MTAPFEFPVWVFVNMPTRAREGFPYYFLTRGGEPTGMPLCLPAFTTKAKALKVIPDGGTFFQPMEVSLEDIRGIIAGQKIEEVILDMGTPDAVGYPADRFV